MGTNYYLKLKKSETADANDQVISLTNGYIYNNTYYRRLEDIEPSMYIKLHIGKSSAGWRFTLCSFSSPLHLDAPIKTLNDWINLFDKGIIVDEYDQQISKEEMIDIITNRQGQIIESEVSKYFIEHKFGKGAWYDSKHRLIGHPKDEYICNPDVTYDITDNWNFC